MKFAVLLTSCFLYLSTHSQNGFTTNNNELEEIYERSCIQDTFGVYFNDARPYLLKSIWESSQQYQYVNTELSDIQAPSRESKNKLLGLFYPYEESFLHAKTADFELRLNPVLELKMGRENQGNGNNYHLFRGAEIRGQIGQNVNFYGLITENQLRPFQYIREYGQGFYGQNSYVFNPYYTYWKEMSNNTGYDFSNALGYLQWNPSKKFYLTIGHDRNHYGYGYRSLLLGDQGAPYFQIKADAYVWKFHYQMLFTQMTGQYVRGGDRLLPKKFGAFHLLTYKPNKTWEIGLFEGIIFHRNDGFELNYLNPLIFYHTIEHSLGSSDNVLIGAQAKLNLNANTIFYSQFLLDDIQVSQFVKRSGWWGNKYGIQIGAKSINLFSISSLDGQIELNAVRPYTYSHYPNSVSDSMDNYTHYNQTLAHPYGANFIETHARISYRPINKLKLEFKYNLSIRGSDSSNFSSGNNIFYPTTGNTIPNEYDNFIAQGPQIKRHFIIVSGQYSLAHNIFWDIDLFFRNTSSTQNSISNYGVMTGIRVNLRKRDYIF